MKVYHFCEISVGNKLFIKQNNEGNKKKMDRYTAILQKSEKSTVTICCDESMRLLNYHSAYEQRCKIII